MVQISAKSVFQSGFRLCPKPESTGNVFQFSSMVALEVVFMACVDWTVLVIAVFVVILAQKANH